MMIQATKRSGKMIGGLDHIIKTMIKTVINSVILLEQTPRCQV